MSIYQVCFKNVIKRTTCEMPICISLHILKQTNAGKKNLKYTLTLNSTCNITLIPKPAEIVQENYKPICLINGEIFTKYHHV